MEKMLAAVFEDVGLRMDTQSYIYMDNMAKSMRRAGVVWLSMAREVI